MTKGELRMAAPEFDAVFASSADEIRAAQRLRYDVFVEELGGEGEGVDHRLRLEADEFDAFSRHLLLLDRTKADPVVGVYRLMDMDGAARAGRFYSEREYDLTPLRGSGAPLLELGRSCLRKEYRGGPGMHHLWSALARHVTEREIDVLFGVASFHGTDTEALAPSLSLLHHRHLAPAELRVTAKEPSAQMGVLDIAEIDRRQAMVRVPALIKAYLRLGGFVGQGAYLDHAFNTTDVCLILPVAQMNARQKRLYLGAERQ
ncbi:MAG: GNAT family N-acyltransferase [Pseudomonadota bacterium]